MLLDPFAYAIAVLALTSATIIGLAEAISFEFAMLLIGAALILSLAIIWLNAKKKGASR